MHLFVFSTIINAIVTSFTSMHEEQVSNYEMLTPVPDKQERVLLSAASCTKVYIFGGSTGVCCRYFTGNIIKRGEDRQY